MHCTYNFPYLSIDLRLGKTLLTRGLHVTLATTELVYHRVFKFSTADAATVPTSITINGIQVTFFTDGFGTGQVKATLDSYMELIGKFGPINLSNLIETHFLNASKKLACKKRRNIVGGQKLVSMARSEKPKAATGENGATK
ncbi:hypothetical protein VIGAN_02186800 [Vigna angularis var. angularis]|uniref:Uncharacterized protein n=1 Tax=Vigna angularis var. angularis TaxID=157739 RepID=A0A0S3REE5_PHAAN|nr:hypothetical protein VIGAN_02186800 [Vigna angularis var. angularis]